MTGPATARRLALAVAGGMLLYAGHPPLDFAWAGLLALAPLAALAADCAGARRPGRAGLWWGLVAGVLFLAPLLEWIARFGVAAWVLLVLLEGALVALAVALAAQWGRRPGFPVVMVISWTAMEALRSVAPLGGFPWGLLGSTQAAGGPLLSAARTVGVLGVGAMCAIAGVAVYVLLSRMRAVWRFGPRAVRGPIMALVALPLMASTFGVERAEATGRALDLAVVQGNDMPETAVVGHGRVLEIARRMASVTREFAREAGGDLPDLIVWPENALDEDVTADRTLAAVIDPALRAVGDTPVLAGMLVDGPRPGTFRNTMAQLAPGPRIEARYVKRHLVPFGEYVPGRRFLDWIPALEQIPSDGVPGEGDLKPMTVAGARLGVVICFENIFPSLSRQLAGDGAEVLLVSTNNASYGFSAASRQHLAFSRMRAVETGRWVVHAGISGISAIIDPSGRVTEQTALFERTVLRAEVPLLAGQTPVMRLDRWLSGAALTGGLAVLALIALRRWKDRRA